MAVVLVVDDRLVNRDLVRTVLEHYGHDTVEAGDGAEALTLLRGQHPDLVLTDVVMPGMDGYQLARAIRSDPASQGIPVLFYTAAYLADEAQATAAANGVSRIVPKTGDLAALIEAVQDALSESR
jgi:two-component system, cell cycle sensor histidine kinase and response regulator CckA